MKRIVKSSREPVVASFGTRTKVYSKVRELLEAMDELSGVEFEEFESYVGKEFYQTILDANQDLYSWSQR